METSTNKTTTEKKSFCRFDQMTWADINHLLLSYICCLELGYLPSRWFNRLWYHCFYFDKTSQHLTEQWRKKYVFPQSEHDWVDFASEPPDCMQTDHSWMLIGLSELWHGVFCCLMSRDRGAFELYKTEIKINYKEEKISMFGALSLMVLLLCLAAWFSKFDALFYSICRKV